MNFQRIKSEVFGTIDAAQTMLNRFPDLDADNVGVSVNMSSNPLEFIVDLFKQTAGYDILLKYVGSVIATAIPAIEISVKALLLSNIRNLLTCSLNPLIPDDLLRNGVVFPINEIDLLGILEMCPLDDRIRIDMKTLSQIADFQTGMTEQMMSDTELPFNGIETSVSNPLSQMASEMFGLGSINLFKHNVGRYYYFGCDGFEKPDDLVNAGDFNAFLWFMKNRAARRHAWRGVKLVQSTFGDSAWGRSSYIVQKEQAAQSDGENKRDTRDAGIITLDYQKNGSSLRNAEGDAIDPPVPFNNAIQVLLGNCEPKSDDDRKKTEDSIRANQDNIQKAKGEFAELEARSLMLGREIAKWEEQIKESDADIDSDGKDLRKQSIKAAKKQKDSIDQEIKEKQKYIQAQQAELDENKNNLTQAIQNAGTDAYRSIKSNHYKNRTLVEFNYDYISSLKLFDSKVVVAQLIDALTGCISVNLDMSFEMRVVRDMIKKTVQDVIESDDVVVSDCFFKFSNKEYQAMLDKAELEHAGYFTADSIATSAAKVDPYKILSAIDAISDGASKEDVESVIEGSLREISYDMYSEGEEHVRLSGGVKFGFIQTILTELANVIVQALMSPKVYLLIAVNMSVLGMATPLGIDEYIKSYRNLITSLIRTVRDQLISILFNKLKELLDLLAIEEAKLFAEEQYEYYRRLIMKCIDCFSRNRGLNDWDMDNVDYADIYRGTITPEEESPREDNC